MPRGPPPSNDSLNEGPREGGGGAGGRDEDPYGYPVSPPGPACLSANVPPPPCYSRRVGRMYVCFQCGGAQDLSYACMVGPCWPMIFVTTGLIAVPTALILWGFARNSTAVCAAGGVLCVFVLGAYALTACRDPGIVQRKQQPDKPGDLYDSHARSYRPTNSHYDYESQTLLVRVDHFCPWTGTVIASGNIISFRIFTNSLCALTLLCIGIAIWALATQSAPARLS